MEDETSTTAQLDERIAVAYVDFDQVDVETMQVPKISSRFDQGKHLRFAGKERSDDRRTDEPRRPSDDDPVALSDRRVGRRHGATVSAM